MPYGWLDELRAWAIFAIDLGQVGALVYLCVMAARSYRMIAGTQRELRRAIHSLRLPDLPLR